MKSIADIQTMVRFFARESTISLVDTDGKLILNEAYRKLAIMNPSGDFRFEDTSISTTKGTAGYDMPNIDWLQILSVSMQDHDDNNKYKQVSSAIDEHEWNKSEREMANSIPQYYNLSYTGGNHKITFRPGVLHNSKLVRITGIKKPKELRTTQDITVFSNEVVDDAFAHTLAYIYSQRSGFKDIEQQQLSQAQSLLGSVIGREVLPREL
jgi:hypothetical protein